MLSNNASIVLNETIKSCKNQLKGFSEVIRACDYVIYLDVEKFVFKCEGDFSLNLFQKMFVNNPVFHADGYLEKVSFFKVQEELKEVLAWQQGSSSEYVKMVIAERCFIYWNIIQQLLQLPPDSCFIYMATDNFFSDICIVSFCFILISGETGLILSGGVSD